MTADVVKECKRLYKEHQAAKQAFEKFESRFEFKDAYGDVKKAIAQKADEVIEPPDDSDVDPRDKA
jgi:hypothetical protein